MDTSEVGRDSIAEMVRMREAGATFGKIGKQFGLSRQRVQQLVSEVIPTTVRQPLGRTPRDYPRVLFHVTKEMMPYFETRASDADRKQVHSGSAYGTVSKRDLVRYWNLIERELATLDFNEAEALYICKALAKEGDADPRFLPTLVADAGGERPRRLMGKLEHLNRCQAVAIIDAAERYRIMMQAGVSGSHAEKLKAVGLLQ